MSAEVVSFVKPIEKLVLEIRAHVHDAGRAETTAGKHQLQAGLRLIALRKRIEAGEAGDISWWDFFEQNFTGHIRSRKYAEKLMRWASSEDPEEAQAVDREKQRLAMRELRDSRSGTHVSSRAAEGGGAAPLDRVGRALRLIEQMSADEREDFHQRYEETYR